MPSGLPSGLPVKRVNQNISCPAMTTGGQPIWSHSLLIDRMLVD
jgi:hypothetical protein